MLPEVERMLELELDAVGVNALAASLGTNTGVAGERSIVDAVAEASDGDDEVAMAMDEAVFGMTRGVGVVVVVAGVGTFGADEDDDGVSASRGMI